MRYIIYGAGGIGGGIGALLTRAGCDVVLIARGDHLTAMREQGLRVRHPGRSAAIKVQPALHPSEVECR
ncbi:MAG: ketopantoate reductase family protein, partial [Chloroflexi bacterium]|nr:ketopantoate reductase family protein [Chloroflexota bacterium]